ncbi:GNAT family N-acetyltransferase [Candidatus Daviesbacteria bacterium]|nr:GNAT family N-acetyltransferase [Candidatus Daviesbacteria bacterium]
MRIANIIQRNKVILRPMREENFEIMFKWLNDIEVMRYWYGRDKPRSLDWIRKHFTPSIKGQTNSTYWIIESDSEPVGYVCNTAEKNDNGEFLGKVEVDILIGDKSRWEKGIGSDALKAMIDYAFNIQKAERVFLTPRVTNNRAIHVYEKVGFKKEGILRHFEKFEGKWVDNAIMSILRGEFKE